MDIVLETLGLTFLVLGLFLIYLPLGFIAAGLCLILVGILLGRTALTVSPTENADEPSR
jgi:hypothetical protein